MSQDNYNKVSLIVEEKQQNNGEIHTSKLMENYSFDSNSGEFKFNVKSNVNGKYGEAGGVLTTDDIEKIFLKIPIEKGLSLPRKLINHYLIGHELDKQKPVPKTTYNYDLSNDDIKDVINNNVIKLKKINKSNKTNRLNKKTTNKETKKI